MLTIKSVIKKLFLPAAILSAFVLFSGSAFAESVFLKDGTILEGKIVKEDDGGVDINLSTGKIQKIGREKILRTVYHAGYKDKKYITKTDGMIIEVYIVDEDPTSYICRTELDSPDEIIISKMDVDTISRRKITTKVNTGISAKHTDEEEMTTRASRIRIGATRGGNLADKYNNEGVSSINGGLLDIFLLRNRSDGNGVDLFLRGTYDYFKCAIEEDYEEAFYEAYYEIKKYSCGLGLRYIYGWYLGGICLQGYLLGYYQYSIIDVYGESYFYSYKDIDEIQKSHGIVGGAGIELSIARDLGFFGEYTYGYTSIDLIDGSENFEDGHFRFGVTLRTPYL